MKIPRLIDRVGPDPILQSWGYADVILRDLYPRARPPTSPFFYRRPIGEQPGLYLPLSFAITYDSSVNLTDNAGTGSLTGSFTCPTLTNGLLVFHILRANVNDLGAVSFNSVALTDVGVNSASNAVASPAFWTHQFYLLGPAAGSHAYSIAAATNHYIIAVATFYSGVKQSGQPEATPGHNEQDSVTTLTASVTVANANSWGVASASSSAGGMTSGTGATLRIQGSFTQIAGLDSAGDLATGSRSMTVGYSPQANAGMVMATYQPDTGASFLAAPMRKFQQAVNRSNTY